MNRRWARVSFRLTLVIVGVFVIANVAVALVFWQRALPHTYLGTLDVSGKTWQSLRSTPASRVGPATLNFEKGDVRVTKDLASLGVSVDMPATVGALASAHSWLPVLNLLGRHYVPLIIHVDEKRWKVAAADLSNAFYVAPTEDHVAWNGSDFVLAQAKGGQELKGSTLRPLLLRAVQDGQRTVAVATTALPPGGHHPELTSEVNRLQKQLNLRLSFVYNGQTVQPSTIDMGGWFASSGTSMSLSADKIGAYIQGLGQKFGITAANKVDLVTAATYAFSKGLALNFAVVPTSGQTVVRTYCTATRQVNDGALSELAGKLAATYADTRGWNDGGRIAFQHVDSGCQYTVWLSAASQMTSFGAICDNYYNCQVGANVVLNYDRWNSATVPWNATGGSLEDYRTLMIDHETGHRLGFLDNPTCPGTGQPAPVMMQQSIDLKGCVFNVWPLGVELSQLTSRLGS